MLKYYKRALVLAPHPDDGEFGCGGTIHRMIKNGTECWYAAFSPCLKSVPENYDSDVLYKELKSALACLGVSNANIETFNFDVRDFPASRQNILEEIIKLREKIKPDLVLLPSSTDIHQDHQVIHLEGIRAFKNISVLGYELLWNNLQSITNCHIKLDEDDLAAKMKAIKEYQSQSFRPYAKDDIFSGLAKLRGLQNKSEYAEAFEVIHLSI